jgi:hypothetical protein
MKRPKCTCAASKFDAAIEHAAKQLEAEMAPRPLAGTLPPRYGTVRAEVLARLLRGAKLTAMTCVFSSNTTRLAPQIDVLRKKYDWPIVTTLIEIATRDGRVQEVAEYHLPDESITSAMLRGDRDFCVAVTLERSRLREAAND